MNKTSRVFVALMLIVTLLPISSLAAEVVDNNVPVRVPGAIAGEDRSFWIYVPGDTRFGYLRGIVLKNPQYANGAIQSNIELEEANIMNQFFNDRVLYAESKNLAEFVMKYAIYSSYFDGKSKNIAVDHAKRDLEQFFSGQVDSTLALESDLLIAIEKKLDLWLQNGFTDDVYNEIRVITPVATFVFKPTDFGTIQIERISPTGGYTVHQYTNREYFMLSPVAELIFNKTFYRTELEVYDPLADNYVPVLSVMLPSQGILLYDKIAFDNSLKTIEGNRDLVLAEVQSYADSVYATPANNTTPWALTDVLSFRDALAFNIKQTNYYVYKAIEYALLGAKTNFSATVTIALPDGQHVTGFLFADYLIDSSGNKTDTLVIDNVYTTDNSNKYAFFIADDGSVYYFQPGETFSVVQIKGYYDMKPLDSVKLESYVPHSGFVENAKYEFAKLKKLEELANLPVAAGAKVRGGGFNLLLIAAVVVAGFLIYREYQKSRKKRGG